MSNVNRSAWKRWLADRPLPVTRKDIERIIWFAILENRAQLAARKAGEVPIPADAEPLSNQINRIERFLNSRFST